MSTDGTGGSEDDRPRLLLMGLRRSGKSSIQKVVFHKLAPNETLFLESTNRINKDQISSFVDFQVWDFPGQLDFFDPTFDFDAIFGHVGALIYIIDAQDEYYDSLARLHSTVVRAYSINPGIHIEVFIHKVDGLSDDYKIDIQRDIQQRVQDELSDAGYEDIQMSFYLTSIFDHSIFEAFSKVIQKLIPQLPTLENLLNIFCSNSAVEKAFLFDVQSKIYIATDSSPVDLQSYEVCSDYIDVIIDVSSIYGRPSTSQHEQPDDPNYRTDASSIIHLGTGMAVYLRELNGESLRRTGFLEYNVQCVQNAIQELFRAKRAAAIDT